MFRYYVRMKKGKKEIYGECYTQSLIMQFIKDNAKLGFKAVESNFIIPVE